MTNFAAHSGAITERLAGNGGLVQELVQVVTTRTRDVVPARSSSAMLLSNLTLSDAALEQLCGGGHDGDGDVDAVPQRLRRLVTLCGAMPQLESVEYVASVLQNCARRRVVRRLLLGRAPPPLQALLDSLHVGGLVRRRGLAHCVRNVCLDESLHSDALTRTTLARAVFRRLFGAES